MRHSVRVCPRWSPQHTRMRTSQHNSPKSSCAWASHRDNESSCDRMMGHRRTNLNYPPRPAQTLCDKRRIV
ncbi:hypothetical protein E2C01_059589 [Portunus trituberculatus]|uniref:Uncharacterized protein n=1 Tax=Portunus trituberculatus TaxID=210409 RepID=A0A5B7H743_PORTR|nr:hypothetical protein [Portunus trituberculatus]